MWDEVGVVAGMVGMAGEGEGASVPRRNSLDDLKIPATRISQAQVGLRGDFWLWLARLAMNIERELFSFFLRFFSEWCLLTKIFLYRT